MDRFFAVPDLGGIESNIIVETTQSLLRLLNSDLGFAASLWLACLWLWLNDCQKATAIAIGLLNGFLDGHWEGAKPRTDEEIVDAWLSTSQVCNLNSHVEIIDPLLATGNGTLDHTKRSGDVIRTARVVAMKVLALAETKEDVLAIVIRHEVDFPDATQVRDGFALGMRALALGRWHVGAGGPDALDSPRIGRAEASPWLTRYFPNGIDVNELV